MEAPAEVQKILVDLAEYEFLSSIERHSQHKQQESMSNVVKKKVLVNLSEYKSLLSSYSKNFSCRSTIQIQEINESSNKLSQRMRNSNYNHEDIMRAMPYLCRKEWQHPYLEVFRLLRKLDESPDITWDSNGTVFIKGSELEGSNITTLVRHTFYEDDIYDEEDGIGPVEGELEWKDMLKSLKVIPPRPISYTTKKNKSSESDSWCSMM
jgi:hypothetical protein